MVRFGAAGMLRRSVAQRDGFLRRCTGSLLVNGLARQQQPRPSKGLPSMRRLGFSTENRTPDTRVGNVWNLVYRACSRFSSIAGVIDPQEFGYRSAVPCKALVSDAF